jgi:hypothetical protein
MKTLLLLMVALAFVLAGCCVRLSEGTNSPVAQYVGRSAEIKKKIVVYERGVFGRLGVPAGEWPSSQNDKVKVTLEPGAIVEVTGVASRRLESGKHYYLACRYRGVDEEVTFDYPADEKFLGPGYISWR